MSRSQLKKYIKYKNKNQPTESGWKQTANIC